MDGGANARVGAAAADVAAHGGVDVVVGGVGGFGEERRRGHDLPGLAVTALGNVAEEPSALAGMVGGLREPFDGDDRVSDRVAHRGDAGTGGGPVEVHRASA